MHYWNDQWRETHYIIKNKMIIACSIFFCYDFAWLSFFFAQLFSIFFFKSIEQTQNRTRFILLFFYLSLHPEWHVTRTKISPINLRCVSYLLVMHHWIEIFLKKKLRWITNKRFTSVIVLYCLELSTFFFGKFHLEF